MTLFMFNASVPGANNNPSDDQNPMLQDNISTLGILGVDHITFNINNGGQHKQITFNQDTSQGFPYVPALPASPPVLFTNIKDGAGNILPGSPLPIPELFYYSGSAAQSSSQYLSQPNGSVLVLGGIIFKWGSSGLIGSQLTFASLGIPSFPNACFSVVVNGNNLAYSGGFIVTAIGPTGFTVSRSSGSPGNTGYYFTAIGN